MRIVGMILLSLALVGCGRSVDRSLDGAYQAYRNGNCDNVMLELSRAERQSRSRSYLQPEISLMRGQCLERQKLYVDAAQTYRFITQRYAQSEYAFRAQARLTTLRQLGHISAEDAYQPSR